MCLVKMQGFKDHFVLLTSVLPFGILIFHCIFGFLTKSEISFPGNLCFAGRYCDDAGLNL